MSYIGQSGRSGHVKVYEHSRALKNSDQNSVLFGHFETTVRTFDLKNPTTLDTEIFQFKREFSEMLHIDLTDSTRNRNADIHKLITSYRNSSCLVRHVPQKPSCLNFPSLN